MYLSISENAARVVAPPAARKTSFQKSHMEVRMFNVAHGEAVVVRFPDNRVWLMEAGSGSGASWTTNNALGVALAKYLEDQGLILNALVISHAHKDHAGAVPKLLETGGYLFDDPISFYRSGSSSWQDKPGKVTWRTAFNNAIDSDGNVLLQPIDEGPKTVIIEDPLAGGDYVSARLFASPGSGVYRSLFVQLRCNRARILFAGDAECPYEKGLLKKFGGGLFRSDVLKVTHHGSSSGTHERVVAAVRHGIAIVSTGDDKGHTLEEDTIERLTRRMPRSRLYETLIRGDIILKTDGLVFSGGANNPDGTLYEVTFDSPGEFDGALTLKTMLKADVDGSVAVLREVLTKLSADEVKLAIRHAGVGPVNDSDVQLAATSNAIIVSFRVDTSPGARRLADRLGVDVRAYRVIYNVTDDIKKALEGLLAPEEKIETRGSAEVREVFHISKLGVVAGCHVTSGTVDRGHLAKVIRDGVVVREGSKLSSLRRFKEDVKEVRSGLECGIRLEGFDDVHAGDVIEMYEIVKIPRKL
ncbi:MAG: MBL fold metallo-hydrolase [Planctomycetes bacterium]|nr:MBL fold metallo-hydrolase [Planctomycetota bacterium]